MHGLRQRSVNLPTAELEMGEDLARVILGWLGVALRRSGTEYWRAAPRIGVEIGRLTSCEVRIPLSSGAPAHLRLHIWIGLVIP
jgi:hypothetical protein